MLYTMCGGAILEQDIISCTLKSVYCELIKTDHHKRVIHIVYAPYNATICAGTGTDSKHMVYIMTKTDSPDGDT